MRMKPVTISLALVLAVMQPLFAAPKDAEASYDKIAIEYTLNNDGSIVKHVVKELSLFTEYAVNKARKDNVLTFDPQKEDLVINSSYLRKKDGSVVLTEAKVRSGCVVVSLDEAQPDWVAVLDYTVVTNQDKNSVLDVTIPLEFEYPASEISVNITIPAGRTLFYEFTLTPSIPMETGENGTKNYKWIWKNTAQLPYDKGHYSKSELHASTVELTPAIPNNEVSGIVLKKATYTIELEYGSSILKSNYGVVTLPFAEGSFTGEPYVTYPSTRSRELILKEHISTSTTYRIKLKNGVCVSGLQYLNKELSNIAGYYSCHAEISGDVLTVVRSLDIYETVIQAKDYEDFRALVAAWADENHIQLTTLMAEGMTSMITGVLPDNSPSSSMKVNGDASISIFFPFACRTKSLL